MRTSDAEMLSIRSSFMIVVASCVFLHAVASHSQNDPHFEPVIKLENQVETATGEEGEDQLFKMCVRRRHTANFMAD